MSTGLFPRAWAPLLAATLLSCAGAQTPPPNETPEPAPRIAVAIRLEEAPDGASEAHGDMPASRATLVLIHDAGETERHDLGTYLGACMPRPPERGELARVECWWAGAGDHLVARRGGHDIVVLSTPMDEESGPGNATLRARVPIPDEAELDPITP